MLTKFAMMASASWQCSK